MGTDSQTAAIMGLCQSAPVSDSVQHTGARGSSDGAQREGQAGQHGHHGGGGNKGGRDSTQQQGGGKGRRTSVDWNKSILGAFSDVKDKYAFDKVLGKGQFGVTRLVVDLATGEQCACKSISKRKLVSAEDMEDVRREIKVMHHLSGHPHVVTFKGGEHWPHQAWVVVGPAACSAVLSATVCAPVLAASKCWTHSTAAFAHPNCRRNGCWAHALTLCYQVASLHPPCVCVRPVCCCSL